MSDQAAFWRRAKQKADRLNRQHAERSPLFAGQGDTTAAEQYWHTRRVVSQRMNHLAELLLDKELAWLEVGQRERAARELLPAEELAPVLAKRDELRRWRLGVEYHLDLWWHALKGRGCESAFEAPAAAEHFDQTALALYRGFFPE
jgi:hypothetical protein